MNDREAVFRDVYREHVWLGGSRSGPGSDEPTTRRYHELLTALLREHSVRSVLDLGCGDWASTRHVDWGAATYLGVDVVPEVVAANTARYGRDGVEFRVLDFVAEPLPVADLVICKEALQHLPSTDVEAVLAKVRTFPLALLTNDVAGDLRAPWRRLRRWEPVGTPNGDIPLGSWRPLDLRAAPFGLDAEVVLRYPARYGIRRWVKEVLLWRNPAAQAERAGQGNDG